MAFALSGSIITQSGTDANPSGLGAIAGVTTQSFGTGSRIRTIYTIPAGRQLAITGTLTHDTDQYLILFSDNAANTGSLTKVLITGVYNYGIKANGQPSRLSGISIPVDPGTWWAPSIVASGTNGNAILVNGSGARFNMQGGQIHGALTIGFGNGAGGTISGGTVVVRDDGITNGQNWLTRILTPNLAFNGYTMIGGSLSIGANTAGQTFSISRPGAGGVAYWLQTQSATPTRIKDYVVGAGYDVGVAPYSDGVGGVTCVPTISQNSAAGTAVNVRGGEPAPSGDIANAGYHAFLRTISTAISTESGLADGFIYVKDTNNGQRKNLNAIDDTPDKVYIGTITSGALSAWSKIGGGGLVYANNYEIISGIVNVVRDATNTRGISNQGIWRKDLRGLSDVEGEDRFNFYVWSYANQYKVINQTLAGAGTLVLTDKVFVDSGVTLSNSAALAKLASSFTINTSTNTLTVTASSTLDDVYDALKAYKCQAIQANLEYPTISTQPVTASGTTIVTAMNVVVNSGVTLSSGAKFTSLSTSGTFTSAGVIATSVVGSVTTTGTFASGASVTGNASQATPTNLTGVTINGNLTFNTGTPVTVTFTNCNVSGVISNSGSGLVKIVKAGTTPWLTSGTNVANITNVIVETLGGLPLSTYIVKNGATDLGWVATTTNRSLEIQQSDTFQIYSIAYGYKAKVVSASALDLTSFKFELLPEPFIDTSLSTSIRDSIASKFSTSFDAYNRIALSLDSDLRAYDPNEVMNAVQYFITTQGSLIAQGVIYGGSVDQVQIINGGILIGTPGFYGKVNDSVTTVNDLGILVPIFVDVLPSVYVTDPTFTPVKKNSSGIILQTAPWTQQTADISAVDKTDIRDGLAREATLALKADQATVAAIPTNPLLTTDTRLSRLDVNVSSRLAAADFSSSAAPTSAQNAAAVRSELATELGRIDAATSSRLAASSYTAPTTPPTSAEVAAAVRTELTTELARIDAAVTTRLAAAAYTAPGTAPTSAQNAQAVRTELAAELARIDAAVSSRLAASGYTAPGPVPTSAQNAAAVRTELALELARLDAAVSSRLAAASYTAPGTAPTSAEVAAAVRTELAAELARLDVASSTRLAATAYTPPDNASITAIKNNAGLIPALF